MKKTESKTQTTLDGVVAKVDGPVEFTRDGLRDAVTKLVVCDDQVSRQFFSHSFARLPVVVPSAG
jgi:threonine dehydratase